MTLQEAIGLITIVMTIVLHLPYLAGAIKGTITPHPFTWILWAILTLIVFFAQVFDGAGPGAWATGLVGIICVAISVASLKNGFANIKKLDVILFVASLLAIPLWVITNDPTLSVILVTTIDLIAFVPTCRKSWSKPYQEPLYFYGWSILRHGLSLFAIVNITVATVFFPFMVMLANGFMAMFLWWRRRVISAQESSA